MYKRGIKVFITILTLLIIAISVPVVRAESGIDVNAIHERAMEIVEYYQDAGYKAAYHNMEPVYVPNYNDNSEIEEQEGCAVVVSDVLDGRINWTAYLDENFELVGEGLAVEKYEYDEDEDLSLIWCLDAKGDKLETGSGYLHDYLQGLKGKNVTVFMAVKDEASSGMRPTIINDMHDLRIQTDLTNKTRYSFFAVVTQEGVIEDLSKEALKYSGTIGDLEVVISSAGYEAGYEAGNKASIMIDGVEYAKDLRGLNVVVFDNEAAGVIDSFAIDTYQQTMPVFR